MINTYVLDKKLLNFLIISTEDIVAEKGICSYCQFYDNKPILNMAKYIFDKHGIKMQEANIGSDKYVLKISYSDIVSLSPKEKKFLFSVGNNLTDFDENFVRSIVLNQNNFTKEDYKFLQGFFIDTIKETKDVINPKGEKICYYILADDFFIPIYKHIFRKFGIELKECIFENKLALKAGDSEIEYLNKDARKLLFSVKKDTEVIKKYLKDVFLEMISNGR